MFEDKIEQLFNSGMSQRTIAKTLNISRRQVKKVVKKRGLVADPALRGIGTPNLKIEEKNNELTIQLTDSKRIRTLEDLIKASDVDLEEWEIERHNINTREVDKKDANGNNVVIPLFQVKVWLKKKEAKRYVNFIKRDVTDFIRKNPSRLPEIDRKVKSSSLMLEVAIYDVHLGKLAWKEETGQDYDLKIARTLFSGSVREHLYKSRFTPLEKIMFVVGNDFFHIDNTENTTTSGTYVDADTRWLKALRTGFNICTEAINYMYAMAPVEVVVIPGNHDKHTTLALGEMLDIFYKEQEGVTVDNNPTPRKYKRFGKVLLGFGHGQKEKPLNVQGFMSSEASDLWSGAKFKEMHLGHFHHQKVLDPVSEHNGVIVRYIPSICATDAWHSDNIFIGNTRTSQSFLWDRENGLECIYYANSVTHENNS